ncbi:MAG: hypothetical protein AB7F38_00230 [Piscinibacter sp.]
MRTFVQTLLASATLLATIAGADETPKRYELREIGASPVWYGSGATASYVLPFDKPYSALSGEQQESLKRQYERMGPTDEPPFPVEGLRALYDPILRGASKVSLSGNFAANIEVDAQGVPVSVAVLRSPNKATTDFVAGVAMLTKFKPAVCEGKPCQMGFPVRITFK